MHHPELGSGWRRLPRWMLPASAAVALAVAATVLLVVRAASDACAATLDRPAALPVAGPQLAVGQPVPGRATYYATDGVGNCSFDPAGPGMYVALGPSEYAGGAACGGYLDVTGPQGNVRVKVVDQCPGCEPGHIDLSEEAFARIGALSAGVVQVTYQQVADPALPGPLTVRVKDGVSAYWLAVRLDNHGNPLASVEVRAGQGWVPLARQDYNYWIKPDGAGPGPYALRVTDTAGHTVTLPGVALAPETVQVTGSAMYQPAGAAGRATPLPSGPAGTSAPAAPSGPASGSPSDASIQPTGSRRSGSATRSDRRNC